MKQMTESHNANYIKMLERELEKTGRAFIYRKDRLQEIEEHFKDRIVIIKRERYFIINLK